MAKKKLFTPGDFDKNQNKSNLPSSMKWLITVVVLIIVVIAIVLSLRGCSGGKVVSIHDSDTIESLDSASSDSISAVTGDSTQTDSNKTEETNQSEETSEQTDEQTSISSSDESTPTATADADADDVESAAMKVIRGEYGNNPVRKNELGTNYPVIQKRVNELKKQGLF